jgi:hypothetical protein
MATGGFIEHIPTLAATNNISSAMILTERNHRVALSCCSPPEPDPVGPTTLPFDSTSPPNTITSVSAKEVGYYFTRCTPRDSYQGCCISTTVLSCTLHPGNSPLQGSPACPWQPETTDNIPTRGGKKPSQPIHQPRHQQPTNQLWTTINGTTHDTEITNSNESTPSRRPSETNRRTKARVSYAPKDRSPSTPSQLPGL